jgi:hypothetical protein
MAQVDWGSIMSGQQQQKKRYAGMNVQFFYAYNENEEKSLKEGVLSHRIFKSTQKNTRLLKLVLSL